MKGQNSSCFLYQNQWRMAFIDFYLATNTHCCLQSRAKQIVHNMGPLNFQLQLQLHLFIKKVWCLLIPVSDLTLQTYSLGRSYLESLQQRGVRPCGGWRLWCGTGSFQWGSASLRWDSWPRGPGWCCGTRPVGRSSALPAPPLNGCSCPSSPVSVTATCAPGKSRWTLLLLLLLLPRSPPATRSPPRCVCDCCTWLWPKWRWAARGVLMETHTRINQHVISTVECCHNTGLSDFRMILGKVWFWHNFSILRGFGLKIKASC